MAKVAFIFPGQGAQKAGMGKSFYENSETARQVFAMAEEVLDFPVREICFEENDLLDQTEYTQAALVTTCLAMEACVREAGICPDVTAGLSLGEYCAIVSAGGMKQEDAVMAVRQRGILMQNTVPAGEGAMAAVLGMDAEKVETVLGRYEDVTIANYNCPGQIVITGKAAAVREVSTALTEASAKRVIPLKVSGPFHSPLLAPAGEALQEILDKMELLPLSIPYVTNVTADYVRDIRETKTLLAKQVAASVRWQQSMEQLIADGVDRFIEIGPGSTLSGFLKKIDRNIKVYRISEWEDLERMELC